MHILIRCADQQTTRVLDLEPINTTIATVQTLIADEIKAEWRALGLRVLRDTLPAAGVMLRFDGCDLEPEKTLAEYGIEGSSEIEATVKRTERDTELMQARARKRGEVGKRRNQRVVKKQKARKEAEGILDSPHQEARQETEEEVARQAEEQFAEETRVLDVELAIKEDDLSVTEARDEQDIDEARQARPFHIDDEIPHEVVVEAAEEDPFDEEDADKENWDPQILRDVGGNRGRP